MIFLHLFCLIKSQEGKRDERGESRSVGQTHYYGHIPVFISYFIKIVIVERLRRMKMPTSRKTFDNITIELEDR